MNAPISRDTAEHYVWGDGCDGWHLVRADSVSIIEERMPAGAAEVRHFHHRTRQFFYVLEGVLTIEQGDGSHALAAGHGLELPPRVIHEVRNDSGEAVRFLVVSHPPSHGDRETVTRNPVVDARS